MGYYKRFFVFVNRFTGKNKYFFVFVFNRKEGIRNTGSSRGGTELSHPAGIVPGQAMGPLTTVRTRENKKGKQHKKVFTKTQKRDKIGNEKEVRSKMTAKEAIRKIMEEQGVSQYKLAELCGMKYQSSVTGVLNRGNSLRVDMLEQMISAMGYEIVIRKVGEDGDGMVIHEAMKEKDGRKE